MSMGMVLEGARDWLRARNNWTVNQCNVMQEGLPPDKAGQIFVAIDEDAAIPGQPETNALVEIFQIEVTVWRRPGHLPKDMRDQMIVPEDRYLPEIQTLHDLERRVIFWLHQRWDFRVHLNEKYGLPDSGRGDEFRYPLAFAGSSGKSSYTTEAGILFIGRRLRFRGLNRTQKITSDLG